jgi:hypothetical protein
MSVHANPTVQVVSADLMDAGVVVVPAHLAVHAQELEDAFATEIVLERNVEMTVVTLETFATSVVPLKFVELTSDVPEHALPTAEIPMDPREFVVTTVASDLVVNVLKFKDKTFAADMVNVSVVLNVMLSLAVLTAVEEVVELVLPALLALMDLVSMLLKDVVEMVFARLP